MNYIICGIRPGISGVGRVMEYLVENSKENIFIYPPQKRKESFSIALKNFKIISLFKAIIEELNFKIKFNKYLYSLFFIKNKEIIILHPQSIGYEKIIRLITRNNAKIYIMDNSFFCIKSYNNLSNELNECLRCIGRQHQNSIIHNCKSFPVEYSYDSYSTFISQLNKYANKILFYTQNNSQTNLLKLQFGDDIKCEEIGLITSDLLNIDVKNSTHLKGEAIKYDIVYHGDNSNAKGVNYVIEIAKMLPQYTFMIPNPNHNNVQLPNLTFLNIRWDDGLKDSIYRSKLTLCPSMWSAPIEGSVIKTIKMGIPLALFKTKNNYSNEVPDNLVLKFSGDIPADVELIVKFMNGDIKIDTQKAKDWIENKLYSWKYNVDKILKV